MTSKLTLFLSLVLMALLTQSVSAQQTSQIVNGEKVSKPWADVVGRQVVVEGLAWGAFEKGLGQRVVLAQHSVYVRNIDFIKHKANGRLVRITGTLRIGRVGQSLTDAGGFSKEVEYFYLDVKQWKILDQVTSPWMKEVMPTRAIRR